MLSTIHLLQFSNYYNRQVKKFDSLSGYIDFLCQGNLSKNPIPNVNFIPNDGVSTKQVINWDGDSPDYLLVTENNEIISRWFVVEARRTLSGQFELQLYRDLIVDFYDQIITAPMFIEKAYVSKEDPAIFNQENMTFNQIKKSEWLLKDNTKTSWIVGYIAPGEAGQGEEIKYGGIPTPDFEIENIEDWEYYQFYNTVKSVAVSNELAYSIKFYFSSPAGSVKLDLKFNKEGFISLREFESDKIPSLIGYTDSYEKAKLIKANDNLESKVKTQIDYVGLTEFNYERLNELDGKIIKAGTGASEKYYRIIVDTFFPTTKKFEIKSGTNAFKAFDDLIKEGVGENNEVVFSGNPNDSSFSVYLLERKISLKLSEMTVLTGYTTHLKHDRPILEDAPYCMICIPYGDYKFINAQGDTIEVDKTNSFFLSSGIATSLGGTGTSRIYDLQLLPYCPIGQLRTIGNTVDLRNLDNVSYTENTDSKTIIFYSTSSSGSFNITYNYYVDGESNIDFKVNNQTQFWRLCSPNYNGVFEFNPHKNGGTSFISVDYTYKPHQPYIHLNPNFGELYGDDFDDVRGLICGGDYSLPIVDDAWVDYQITNKNFQNIFNRQIQSMELKNKVAKTMDIINAITGTVGGGLSGAIAGGFSGLGMTAGAVAGVASSAFGGIADVQLNEMLRNDAMDLTKDLFGYQMDNIKAIPDALTRVSSYNKNNKIFPFIERYDATDEEKEALKNKIIYNGMSIGRIGKLEDYILNKPYGIWGYFKGQIIRIEDIPDDFHIVNSIAKEINKGVYIV